MTLDDFRQALLDHPGCGVRFVVDGGGAIADHFHVTEVGRVEKRFVDCGGVRRSSAVCVLQTLVAQDTEHRLSTDKLAKIVALADGLGLPGDVSVEVEHQERSVSTDVVGAFSESGGVVEFRLAPKQTACLAEDACGIGPKPDGPQAGASAGLAILGDGCCDLPGSC